MVVVFGVALLAVWWQQQVQPLPPPPLLLVALLLLFQEALTRLVGTLVRVIFLLVFCEVGQSSQLLLVFSLCFAQMPGSVCLAAPAPALEAASAAALLSAAPLLQLPPSHRHPNHVE